MSKLSAVVVIFVILLGLYGIAQVDYFPSDEYVEIDILEVEGTTLAIGSGCKAMIAETSEERAESIHYGLVGVIEDRPTIYDGFVEVLDTYDMEIVSMAIEGRDDSFYYSNLVLQSPTKVLKIDMKPSDAIALCLRVNATMYIKRELLELDGVDIC